MEFKLNEYHRNTSKEDFILDVKKTAKFLNKTTLTIEEYTANGKYHPSTLTRKFGSWKKVLELSGLDVCGHNFKVECSIDDIAKDLERVVSIYGKKTITVKEYDLYGKYSSSTLVKKYKGWNNILKFAGMDIVQNRNITDIELLEDIERIWILLGRQPTTNDIKSGISKFSLNSYARKFGSWRGALDEFITYINNEQEEFLHQNQSNEVEKIKNCKSDDLIKHVTKRDVNLRLRFLVMQRDNFKCCMCGASPAKDPNVELHIDHIIPWSKGGETTIDNLQTLCSKCNLGKSNL